MFLLFVFIVGNPFRALKHKPITQRRNHAVLTGRQTELARSVH
jgi:hypothetical protein